MSFKHVGKTVSTGNVEFERKTVFKELKAGTNRLASVVFDGDGLSVVEVKGRRGATLSDNSDPISSADLIEGFLAITPTSGYTKQLPTAAILEPLLFERQQYSSYQFSIINLSGSQSTAISTNTGTTSVGSLTIQAGSSARFELVKQGVAGSTPSVKLYRIA